MTERRSLSQMQRLKIFEEGSGVCHICGRKIQTGEKWEAEHIIALALNGPDYDIRESNLAPAHVKCHADKTRADRARIAKAKRMKAKHYGVRRSGPPMAGPASSNAIWTGG